VKLSKQRKVYVALLGLGLLVLAVDKFMLAPEGAGATEPPLPSDTPAADATPQPKAEPSAPPSGPAKPPLANRLAEALRPDAAPARDGFRASPSWIQPPKGEESEAPAPVTKADKFIANHKLMMILTKTVNQELVHTAVIAGKVYRIGDALDGFTLAFIDHEARRVVFKADGESVELALPAKTVPVPQAGETRPSAEPSAPQVK
jgi:hypothetical protein